MDHREKVRSGVKIVRKNMAWVENYAGPPIISFCTEISRPVAETISGRAGISPFHLPLVRAGSAERRVTVKSHDPSLVAITRDRCEQQQNMARRLVRPQVGHRSRKSNFAICKECPELWIAHVEISFTAKFKKNSKFSHTLAGFDHGIPTGEQQI